MVVAVVVLRREVVAFWLPLLAGQRRVLEALVHVMWDRTEVIEELAVHRPALVFVPHRLADQPRAVFCDGFAQQKVLVLEAAEAKTFVPLPILIGGFGGAGEPAFIDPASLGPQRVVVVRVQLDPPPRMQKATRHPCRCEPQQSLASL